MHSFRATCQSMQYAAQGTNIKPDRHWLSTGSTPRPEFGQFRRKTLWPIAFELIVPYLHSVSATFGPVCWHGSTEKGRRPERKKPTKICQGDSVSRPRRHTGGPIQGIVPYSMARG